LRCAAEVYSYVPEPDSDTLSVGKLWNVFYFFYK
jgi:hypothetical protein